MCNIQMNIHKANGQFHLAGAMRQFANEETLKDVAELAGLKPQMLRNKLLHEQPHQLSMHELIKVTNASGNRCLVDGILLDLGCTPSVEFQALANAENMSLTDRALEITTNAGALGSLALDIKIQRKVTEKMRNVASSRARRVMQELAIFIHDVECKFQAIPTMSIAVDAMQTMPLPGLM